MTIFEKLQVDLLENEKAPLFAPYNDDNLGERFDGHFEKYGTDNGKEYKRFFFDNGHNYTFLLDERMLYECEPIPEDYFIHKHIEKCLYDTITSYSDEDLPLIACMDNEVFSKDNKVVLFRAIIDRDSRIVSVTNIFVQMDKRHLGIGKRLLGTIYAKCKHLDYRLMLTEMVESFYVRMVRRGAKVVEVGNVVEIDEETNLSSQI